MEIRKRRRLPSVSSNLEANDDLEPDFELDGSGGETFLSESQNRSSRKSVPRPQRNREVRE
jgi:hypothetical protein